MKNMIVNFKEWLNRRKTNTNESEPVGDESIPNNEQMIIGTLMNTLKELDEKIETHLKKENSDNT